MTRSTYCMVALTFIIFTADLVDVLGGHHSLSSRIFPGIEREGAFYMLVGAAGVAGWLRATFLRIRDIGLRNIVGYLLCTVMLACWISVLACWARLNNEGCSYLMLIMLHLPFIIIKRSGMASV